MAEIINLRQVRKAKKRDASAREAEANRFQHGRSKAEKTIANITRQKFDDVMDGARREPTDD